MRVPRNICWRLLARRLAALVTLAAYLAATFGVPLPARASRPGRQAFPCQGLLCGCDTAEQCDSCGCFTSEERQAWAKAHNPQPAPEEKPVGTCCCNSEPKEGCPHCAHKSQPPAPPTKACCATKKKPDAGNGPADRCRAQPGGPTKDKTPVRWGGMSAWRCAGLSMLWVGAAAVAPAAPPVQWQPLLDFVGWLGANPSHAAGLPFTPPDPPPRS